MFSNPPSSSEIVCIYHEFHQIYGASIVLDWISDTQFNILGRSLDGAYEIQIVLHLHDSFASRLLLAIGSGPPTRFKVSNAMVAVSNFLVNSLVAKGGSALSGKTETGQPFYHGDTEKLFPVQGGSLSLNGEDKGTITSPTWSIEFGDAVPFVIPVLKLGTLYIPFEQDMVEESA